MNVAVTPVSPLANGYWPMKPAKWLVPEITVTRPYDRPTPARSVVLSFKLYAALNRGATSPFRDGIRLRVPSRPAPSPAKIRAPGEFVTGLVLLGSNSEY